MRALLETVRELRRRKVFRGVGLYVVGAWSIVQVADVIAEPLGLPSWTVNALLFLSIVGFPVGVWVAWRYEWSDAGLVRTQPASATDVAAADLSLKITDYLVLIGMLAVVVIVSWRGLDTIRLRSVADEAPPLADESSPAAANNTIAVLPFTDLSPDADHGYLADGMSETVLHVLSQVRGLQVTGRTSSFAFRDRPLTSAQIAAALGVAHLLEGSVQRAGDQIRVIARVVDARSGVELWSGNFDRGLDAIFAIQDEIAQNVAASLKVNVMAEDGAVGERYRPSLEAYEQYILGQREKNLETAEGADAAVAHMERAIELDPDYALAYVGLSDALRIQNRIRRGNPFEVDALREPLLEKALELDPLLAEAWVDLGSVQALRKDFEGGFKSVERALELNPNLAAAHAAYSNYLMFNGTRDEVLAAIKRAVELDPESQKFQRALAEALWGAARAEEAMATLKRSIAKRPENPRFYELMARWQNQLGRPGEAMRYLQAIRERDPDSREHWKGVCEQFFQLWDMDGAGRCLREYLGANPDDLDARKWLAGIVDGDIDGAIRIGEEEVQTLPSLWYPKVQLAGYLAMRGEWQRIIELLAEPFPQLVGEAPQVNDLTQWPARHLAEAYWKSGRIEQAERLNQVVLDWVERSRKLHAGGWMAGAEDAMIYCIREQRDRCIDALGAVVDAGWTFYAFSALGDTAFDSVRDDPRFQAIVDRLEDKLAKQREYFEAHRHEPII